MLHATLTDDALVRRYWSVRADRESLDRVTCEREIKRRIFHPGRGFVVGDGRLVYWDGLDQSLTFSTAPARKVSKLKRATA